MVFHRTAAGQESPQPPAAGRTAVSWRIRHVVRAGAVVLAAAGFLSAAGCSGVTDEGKLPPDVPDPTTLRTPSGAVARYQGTLAAFGFAFDHFMTITGLLTDELANGPVPLGVTGTYTAIDSRTGLRDDPVIIEDYNRLHLVRAEAREARGFLHAYAPDSSTALTGHLYAVEGYADMMLADLFCSGIPLSTIEFDSNYTLQPGSSTTEVYQTALSLFDSAAALASDSLTVQYLAALGRGRALLALGRYSEAAGAVASVPDNYQYLAAFANLNPAASPGGRLMERYVFYAYRDVTPSVGDFEGTHGLAYRSDNDPRVAVQQVGTDKFGNAIYFPAKYPSDGNNATYLVAGGIEARLIEAEALLQASPDDGQWLTKLNALRQTVGLSDTTDPGVSLSDPAAAQAARVDLLFRERAFWLYLTGHRQGDLRRLVRNYHRNQGTVYPSGSYPGGTGGYGSEFFAPVPTSEAQLNPKYSGCLD